MLKATVDVTFSVAAPVVFVIALPFMLVSSVGAQPATTGRLVGVVTGPSGSPLPGVVITMTREDGTTLASSSGNRGEYAFEGLVSGRCRIAASLTGYEDFALEDVVVVAGDETRLDFALALVRIAESILIQDVAPEEASNEPMGMMGFDLDDLDALPLPTDRFQEALPLVPGVLRDPEGRLSFNGARPSQSTLLVNGANVTDPVSGEFAVELPLKAIEAVEVNSLPYSAEYGRVTGAVAKVETRGGTDEFDIDFGDFWPKPNFRDGKIKGIRTFIPQVQLSGPIKKGRAWFSQGIAYRFTRSRIRDVAEGDDERILENFDSFTQLDFRVKDRHHLTTTFSYFPVEVENLGLNALDTADASPTFESAGWNAAFSERSYFSRTLVETMVAIKRYDIRVEPEDEGSSRLTPDGLRGNYFNELDRDSTRVELSSSCTHAPTALFGEHVMKFGGNVSYASFSGSDAGRPIDIVAEDGRRLRRIEFTGDSTIEGSDVQVSAFIQDQWRPTDRVGIDVGLRYDYDRFVAEHQFAPRLSAAVALDPRGRTVFKAGWGIFYDHVFLRADGFDDTQRRVETTYGPDGLAQGAPVVYAPRTTDRDLETPRSKTWNVEWGQLLGAAAQLRVSYRERRGTKEMIVDRVEPQQAGADGSLLLSSRGASFSREMDVTLRVRREESELFASYVRSRTTGDLNNVSAVFQNLRSPLFLANESSRFELDVPHRALFWGVWKFPKDIIVSPGFEWRSGFPYTVFAEDYTPVGARNGGGRFPAFLSADVRVTKGMRFKGHDFRIGFQIFNLGSHFNPRDVVSNSGSSRSGRFLNSPDMGFSLRFSLGT